MCNNHIMRNIDCYYQNVCTYGIRLICNLHANRPRNFITLYNGKISGFLENSTLHQLTVFKFPLRKSKLQLCPIDK